LKHQFRAAIIIALFAFLRLTSALTIPTLNVVASTPTCPAGTSYSTSAGLCQAPPTCPSGFSRVDNNECRGNLGYCPSGWTFEETTSNVCATCPSGLSLYGSNGYDCTAPPTCPSGTTLSGSKCSDGSVPTCPSGTTFSNTIGLCDETSMLMPYLCPAGSYNEEIGPGLCGTPFICPLGTSFENIPGFCEGPASFACLASNAAGLSICAVIGHPNLTTLVAGRSPNSTDIGNPSAVAFDSKGNLWVVDNSNNRVLEYGPPFSTGEAASVVIGQTSLVGSGDSSPSGGLYGPTGLAFDSEGNLWVADGGDNRVLEFKSPFSDGQLASLVLGQSTFGGYVATTTSFGMQSPAYLAFDSSGNLWVSDQGNNRVLEFNAPFKTGEKASIVIGQANFTSSDPTTTATGLFEPLGIAFDSSGNLWVADSANHRILGYAPPFSTDEAANVVLGQPGFTSGGGSKAGLNAYSIAFDSDGNLWVSDGINGVVKYPVPLKIGEAAIQVIAPITFAGNSTVSAGSKLEDPQGLAFDMGNNLWLADFGHGRVLEYSSGTSVSTSTLTSSSSSSSSSSGSGGIPEFSYQPVVAVLFTVLLTVSYIAVRRRTSPSSTKPKQL